MSDFPEAKVTLKTNYASISGEAIDLDSFCGGVISESEKTEEIIMNTWFKEISAIFVQSKKMVTATSTARAGGLLLRLKGDRLLRYVQSEI